MRVVVQRVKSASVAVGGEEKAAIKKGLLLLVGIAKKDTPEAARRMARKINKLRLFEDSRGKMNLDIRNVKGEALSVPQFTLAGITDRGNRPGFDAAAPAAEAEELWGIFNEEIRASGIPLKQGIFGEHMEISLVNDGPVTFILDLEDKEV